MVRILQLLDHVQDFETRRAVEGLARSLGDGFAIETRTVGEGGTYRNVAIATAKLRRGGGSFDLVHAFGGRALASAALGTRLPIVFSPAAETKQRTREWLRAVMAHRKVEVVCATSTLRKRFVQRGVPFEQCHLIRPGVEFSRVRRRKDDALRERLGFRPGEHVLLCAGESTQAAAHADAVWAAGILHYADAKYRLLVWGRGESAAQLKRFADKIKQTAMLSIATEMLGSAVEFEDLLAATDTVVVPARGAVATLPIATAMAAGLPIVSTVTYTLGELLEDRHTALMTPAGKPRQLARRVLDLMEDPGLQWTIADMARTEAYEYFAFTRFMNQFREVYRKLAASEKVTVTEEAPGAGLRFHGRA